MAKSKTVAAPTTTIMIPSVKIDTLPVPITGTSPLILHRWSRKAIAMMEMKQAKKAAGPKAARDPEDDYNEARYISAEGWDGVPSVAFKAALVGACRQCDGLDMTKAKRLFFVEGDGTTDEGDSLTRIIGEPRLHRSMVRVGMGTADIRYRPIYTPWAATLRIRFNAGVISAEQVVNLVQLAGMCEGVGEWRPSSPKSSTGVYGLWEIDES